MHEYIQANTNGHLHDARTASISPLDRGFLYGDAVYEVWRTYGSVVFAWAEHWVRLEQSASALGFGLSLSAEEAFGEVRRTAAAYRAATGDRCKSRAARARSASTRGWRIGRTSCS